MNGMTMAQGGPQPKPPPTMSDHVDSDDSEPSPQQSQSQSQSQSSPSGWHNELKVFEADRRTKHQSNMESLTLYWKAHCDLLDNSVHETAKAYRLVRGVSKAHERMATTLAASASSVSVPASATSSVSAPNEQQLQQQLQHQQQQERTHHLTALEEANASMIQHFGESATTMETNVASSLSNLLQTIQATQQQVSKEGQQMLRVLEKHEAQVEQAWDSCFDASAASLPPSRDFSQPVMAGEIPSSAAVAAPVVGDSLGSPKSKSPRGAIISRIISSSNSSSGGDPWLAEFQYRRCLDMLEQVWTAKRAEFVALFATVCDAECMRRINLRESMIMLVRQQQHPFTDVEESQSSALTAWVEKETSQQEVQEHVEAAIRTEVEALLGGASASTAGSMMMHSASPSSDDKGGGQVSSPTTTTTTATATTTTDRQDDMAVYRRQFTPVSPLASDYLLDAFVVEQRDPNPDEPDGSKIVLAVVTSDSFLHLFELASGNIDLRSTPEEAFQALLPTRDPPLLGKTTPETTSSASASAPTPAPVWNNGRLQPLRTVDLDHCSVALVREETVVEIFETTSTHGSVNRIVLAVSSPRDRSTFAAAIQRGSAVGANA